MPYHRDILSTAGPPSGMRSGEGNCHHSQYGKNLTDNCPPSVVQCHFLRPWREFARCLDLLRASWQNAPLSSIVQLGETAMGIHRSHLRRRDRVDALETKARNRIPKGKERVRRDARMLEKIRAGTLPYAAPVMSWLSRKLDKKANTITQDDIKTLLD